jgi:hypothetical protein
VVWCLCITITAFVFLRFRRSLHVNAADDSAVRNRNGCLAKFIPTLPTTFRGILIDAKFTKTGKWSSRSLANPSQIAMVNSACCDREAYEL